MAPQQSARSVMRGRIETITYPAFKNMSWHKTTETPPPNCWSLEHDERVRSGGVSFSQYRSDRKYHDQAKPASNTDYYNIDQSNKMSLAHKVHRSPYRYGGMLSESAGRGGSDTSYLGNSIGTPERVGPGSYSPIAASARGYALSLSRGVGSSAFASRQARTGNNFGLPGRTAEPGYASLAVDERLWMRRANGQPKGASFGCAQRWKRPPGPGSNLPAEKDTPGPGSYVSMTEWLSPKPSDKPSEGAAARPSTSAM